MKEFMKLNKGETYKITLSEHPFVEHPFVRESFFKKTTFSCPYPNCNAPNCNVPNYQNLETETTEKTHVCADCGSETNYPNLPCKICHKRRIVLISVVKDTFGKDWKKYFHK